MDFAIPQTKFPNVTDSMVLRFGQNPSSPTANLKYLRWTSQPVVTAMNDLQTIFTGQNLFYEQLRVGDGVDPLPLKCIDDGSECRIKSYPDTAEGYLYFIDAEPPPAMLVKGGTTATAVFHTAPKPRAPATAKLKPTGQGTESTPPSEPAQTPAPTQSQKFSIEDLHKSLQAVQ